MSTAATRFACAVLILVGPVAIAPAAWGAFSPEDVAKLKTALAGKTVVESALLPRGFAKVVEAKGDLDGDGIDDVALIVRRVDKNGRPAVPAPDDAPLPQAVLIFTGDKSNKYSLWKLGASHFMDFIDTAMGEAGVELFEIKKGILKIVSNAALSAGSGAGGCTLKWRNGPAGFQLIGLGVVTIDRNCACGTTEDTNYLTGLTIHTNDRSKHGNQLAKVKTTRAKTKPTTILWESFDFEKMCEGG